MYSGHILWVRLINPDAPCAGTLSLTGSTCSAKGCTSYSYEKQEQRPRDHERVKHAPATNSVYTYHSHVADRDREKASPKDTSSVSTEELTRMGRSFDLETDPGFSTF